MNPPLDVFHPRGLDYAQCVKAITRDLAEHRLVPLFGAGISFGVPAELPMAEQLMKPLRTLLETAVDQVLAQYPTGTADRNAITIQLNAARLERLLDSFQRVYGEVAMEWLSVLDSRNCNDNHLALAELVAAGVLPHIMTLNFDTLIEQAIERRQLRCRTRCTLHPAHFPPGDAPVDCVITKPHGSIFPDAENRFRYLGATISQVGTHVSRRTLRIFAELFRAHPTLLVAGYSDDDWDIMPALMHRDAGVKRLIWVQHSGAPPDRAMQWMRRLDAEGAAVSSIALKGNVTTLLLDCLAALGGKPPAVAESQHPLLTCDEHTLFNNAAKNTLVFAQLLHDDRLKEHLLNALGRLSDLALESLRLSGLSSVAHTGRKVEHALRLNRRAFRLRARLQPIPEDDLAERLVWLGYEHLCLCKRPTWRRPLTLVGWPWHLARGLMLLRHGSRTGPRETCTRRVALAAYYRADLIHSWMNAVVARGPKATAQFRGVFRWLVRRYAFVESLLPDLMGWEYYWLRQLEARLFAGVAIDYPSDQATIRGILDSYRLIQNSVQMGNPYAYLALLEFMHGPDPAVAVSHFNEAERIWTESFTPAGLERVATFRRYCGIRGA